jgi:type VI secretion lipoprotein, VC_A0113 family
MLILKYIFQLCKYAIPGAMTRRVSLLLMLVTFLALAQGCSSVNSALGGNTQKEAKAEVSWDFQRDGIQIELVAAEDLNAFFDQPHTLVLGVLQLEDSKPFLQLLNDRKTVTEMLSSGNPTKDVLQLDRYIVTPGKRDVLDIDRVQNAKYVGMIAGYYRYDAEAGARLFRIPLNISTEGLVSTTHKAVPANLALRLYLGRQRITNAQSLTFDPDKKPDVETIPLINPDTEVKLDNATLKQAKEASGATRKLRQ